MVRRLIGLVMLACVLTLLWRVPCEARVMREYYESGKLMTEFTMSFFTLDGPMKTYYESGQLMEESCYKDGLQQGKRKEYYESGKLRAEWDYKDDKPLVKKAFYENGTLKEDWNFKVDDPGTEAMVKYYDTAGKLIKEQPVKKRVKKKRKKNKK